MRSVTKVEELARKGERVTVQFDDPELLRKLEELAGQAERPVSREIVVWLKMAMELVEEQGFHVVNGKLRKVAFEELDTND